MVVNINKNITGEESFPCKGSMLLVSSYLQRTQFLFLNGIMHCLTADYITLLNSQQHTSPHPALCPSTSSFGRDISSSSLSNLIPLAVQQSTGARGKAACVVLL